LLWSGNQSRQRTRRRSTMTARHTQNRLDEPLTSRHSTTLARICPLLASAVQLPRRRLTGLSATATISHTIDQPTNQSRPVVGCIGGTKYGYVPPTDTGSLCLAVDSTHTVVGLFRLLVRRCGTHCQMNSEIRRVMSTASNSSLKQSCSALTSVTSTLEVIFLTLCAL